MTKNIQYERNDKGYSIIRLNRPEKHNAISVEMVKELRNCLEQAKQDEVKCLVITGAGERMFCAGGDLNDLHGDLNSDEAFNHLHPMKEVLYEIASFPVPTICLLNGDALGGGCELATSCDFRITTPSTKFGFVQANLGIIPGWGGGVLLYEKVSHNFAYQWLLEAKVYPAEELKERGWIQHIVDDFEEKNIDNLLEPYLSKSYDQMKILKNQYKKALSANDLSSRMEEEVKNCAYLWTSEEHKQAVERFFQRKQRK
ncbi:MAG TPA: enoyl-CoA hydratase/isomerase family protein [Bacillota bacterium]|nr:enoyl-CoA hydratase/isomerase family protein [Bacillota bacterium]